MTAGWVVAIVHICMMVCFLVPQTRGFMRQLIWPNLAFTLIVLLSFHKKWSREFVFSILLIACTGFFIDVIAVKTGYIFGYFQYGATLGYKLWETPLMMIVYWVILIYTSRQVAEMVAKDNFLVSIVAAGLMVLMDYFLEPFAVRNGLWSWNGGTVPMHNYIGWFVSAIIMQYIFCKSIKIPGNKLSLPVYLIQLGFYIGLFLLVK